MLLHKRKSCQLTLNTIIIAILGLSLFVTSRSVYAEDANALMAQAHDFILTHLPEQLKSPQVTISSLPKATQKPTCQQPLKTAYHGRQRLGNINIVITCSQPYWQQYVHAQLSGKLPAYVAIRDIMVNEPITANNVKQTWIPYNQLSSQHISQFSALEHKSSRQFIATGSIIRSNHLKPSLVIHINDLVNIVSDDPRIHIEMRGIALESGSIGQAIRVKNSSSNKIIKAYIQSADTVVVR